jgi:fructose-1,6-bisphosphatase/inositol monophosphatase family enzyme
VSLLSVALSRELLPLLLASNRFVGTRAMGCACLGLAWAAEGRFALHAARNYPWDVAAGYLLVERAGGRVVDLRGEPVSIWDRVHTLAGAPAAVDLALEILSGS